MEQDANGNILVARVLAGSTIEKEGLMHPGDVILEVNGAGFDSPEELMQLISECKSTLQIRIAYKNDSEQVPKTQQVIIDDSFS